MNKSIQFSNNILNNALNNSKNTDLFMKKSCENILLKLSQKKESKLMSIDNYFNKKPKLVSTGQQTKINLKSINQNKFKYNLLRIKDKNNSMIDLRVKINKNNEDKFINSTESKNRIININSMISDKFANIKQMQKIPFIPRKIKRAESVRELYTQKEKKQKKIKGHIINFLKKANKNYNNSPEIIRYKNKSLKKEIPNKLQKTNYDNLITKIHLNYNNINNNSNKINDGNVDSFSKIIFSIIKSNTDKNENENEFKFKMHKHSNINISTMLELTKSNFHKHKNNNI
jgi:hypothetical protein